MQCRGWCYTINMVSTRRLKLTTGNGKVRRSKLTCITIGSFCILGINNSWALISYPTSSGRKQGYIRTSSLSLGNYNNDVKRSRSRINNVYARSGVRYPNSAIYQNDQVWTVARQGNYTQVIYPAGNIYKMVWISNSDYDNYIADKTPATTPARIKGDMNGEI